MMRVLHYSTWQVPCGVADYTADLVGALERIGCTNTIRPIPAASHSAKEWEDEWDALCKQARRYDVLHIQHEFAFFRPTGGSVRDSNAAFCRLLKRLERDEVPTVVTFHTDFSVLESFIPAILRRLLRAIRRLGTSYENALTNLAFRWKAPKATTKPDAPFRFIVHANRTKAGLTARGIHPALVNVLPVGIAERPTATSPEDRARARELLGLPRDGVLMAIYGFVAAYKGHLLAKQALAHLPDDYHLVVVGGPHPETIDYTLDELLNEPNPTLKSRLHVTGYVDAEQAELHKQATDLVLAPYRDAGLSGSAAINWGLSSGKPIVAANIPTFREINHRVKCLELVTPDAVHELAWQIKRVMNSPSLQQALTDGAEQYMRQTSCAAVATSTYRIYEDLVRPVGLDYRQAA